MYLVLIEWDGQKPPTTYYNRMRRELGLSLNSRYDLDRQRIPDPLARRRRENNGWRTDYGQESITFQEGAVLCTSNSLARTVFMMAKEFGAKNVQMFSANSIDFHLTTTDAEIMSSIEAKAGQRGRKSKSQQLSDWAVTCYEEQVTFLVKESYYVISCPSCSSTNVNATIGEVPLFEIPTGIPVFEAWVRHRFARGHYEVPHTGSGIVAPARKLDEIAEEDERKTVEKMSASGKLMQEVAWIEQATNQLQAMRILDSVFAARCKMMREVRREARAQTCVKLYERGVDPGQASVIENDHEFDVIDGAFVDPTRIAGLWMRAIKPKLDKIEEGVTK